MRKKRNHPTWTALKKELQGLSNRGLIALVGDLFKLNSTNRTFLEVRLRPSDQALRGYKERVEAALCPDIVENERVRLSDGRKCISEYWKASGDPIGRLDLMICFVEAGTRFAVVYGAMDDGLCRSLTSMFESALKKLSALSEDDAREFWPRLEEVVTKAHGTGWWYQETLEDLLDEAFPTR